MLVDKKDQGFEFRHFIIKRGWCFRCNKECNHLEIEEKIPYSCFYFPKKEINYFQCCPPSESDTRLHTGNITGPGNADTENKRKHKN